MKKKLWLSAALLAGLPAVARAQWIIDSVYGNTSVSQNAYGEYVTLGNDGNIYVISTEGGTGTDGQLIKLALTWSGINVASTPSVLHDFSDETYGLDPSAPVVEDANDNFFGTSKEGAGSNTNGDVWEYSAAGTMSVIYQFTGATSNGCAPTDITLVPGAADTVILYGEAYGCVTNEGALFKLKGLPGTASSWHIAFLHEFTGGSDGSEPSGGLLLAVDGYLYGTTHYAGSYNYGTIFGIDTSGGTINDIASFPSNAGATGRGLVERDASDSLMLVGARVGSGLYGVIYDVKKVRGGSFTYATLVSLPAGGSYPSENPQTNLVWSSALGYFFGTSYAGGYDEAGSFFSLTPSGTLSNLNAMYNRPVGNLIWANTSDCSPCVAGVGSETQGTPYDYGEIWIGIAP